MKGINKRTLFVLVFCLGIFVLSINAQKNKDEIEVKSEPEIKSPPVEVKSEPPPTVDTTPTYESPKSEPSNNGSSNTSYSNNEGNPPTTPSTPRTTIRNDVETQRRRAMQREEIERQQREARRRNKKDKDDDDYYRDCPTYDPYGDCDNYIDDDSNAVNSSINPLIYFNRNDIAYFNYKKYVESMSSKYLSFYQNPLSDDFKPLYNIGFVEAAADLPYISPFWAFYYEPDLDNFYIDFSSLDKTGTAKFDRLILVANNKKTINKVGKHFNYKEKVRPILVEDISSFSLDRIYTFNLSYLPKGNYELTLLSLTGNTVKLDFKIK